MACSVLAGCTDVSAITVTCCLSLWPGQGTWCQLQGRDWETHEARGQVGKWEVGS